MSCSGLPLVAQGRILSHSRTHLLAHSFTTQSLPRSIHSFTYAFICPERLFSLLTSFLLLLFFIHLSLTYSLPGYNCSLVHSLFSFAHSSSTLTFSFAHVFIQLFFAKHTAAICLLTCSAACNPIALISLEALVTQITLISLCNSKT